ncbi:hypothetical protein CBLAS_0150 [Campylobacter blaseri]|uniref:Lipoprotein n=1 Tax=Campylobacter blaseri TaxID=2042961 RepID=A0A2P8R0Z2_9BACT|nr:hypothetical protein [Campylobacter blaseri]PSM52159.1 hypothetical protein CQ405_03650 [Campylobacter blaseri]PSM53925.1 hypothetical protein CRN67_03650 [Campylobacter blaseri]QKF85360.1 hypothetical protein CBLAS_0150 [Campylobacter blaseri]
MKKIIYLIISLIFIGCSNTAEYNTNMEMASANESLSANKPLQKAYIYISSESLKAKKIKSSTSLGKDNLEINLGSYAEQGTLRFFKHYLANLEVTNDKEVLSSSSLIIIPDITTFEYGFYSDDGFDVDSKPFVRYDLQLSIYKNGSKIYNKNISSMERNYGEKTFFGMGTTSYMQIGPIFQKAIANDYNTNAVQILDSINKAK